MSEKNIKNAIREKTEQETTLKNLIPKFQSEYQLYTPRIYTDNEKKTMLEGYVLLKKHEYKNLKRGDHIRYENDKGEFKRGGFIDMKFENKIRLVRLLNSQINETNMQWIINLSTIKNIWRKPHKINNSEMTNIKNNFDLQDENNKTLLNKISLIEKNSNINIDNINNDIIKIKNDISMIINTLKSLKNDIEIIKIKM